VRPIEGLLGDSNCARPKFRFVSWSDRPQIDPCPAGPEPPDYLMKEGRRSLNALEQKRTKATEGGLKMKAIEGARVRLCPAS